MSLNMILLVGTWMASFIANKMLKWDSMTLKNLKRTYRNLSFVFWTVSMIAIYTGMDSFRKSYISYRVY